MLRSEELKINLEEIKKKIPNNVRLVAVSKTKPIEDILSIYNCGQRHFGENVQELVEKAEVLPKDINWHFIGTLQSNKAKALAAVPNLFLVETLGSVKAANSLNKACEIRKEKLKVYIQVNTSGEESKSGINPNDAVQFAKHVITECHFLDLAGLMTIGFANPDLPNMKNPDFECLLKCRDLLEEQLNIKLELSMGMSNDFENAIKMGSTNVRVGSGIFGQRNYNS